MDYIFPSETLSPVLESLAQGVGVLFICCVLIVVAIFMDMWVGIEAARAVKEPLMSGGFRRTLTKGLDYFRIVFFAALIDILGAFFVWYHLPFFTLLATLAILLIEGKSVIENYRRKKSNAAQVLDVMGEILEAKDKKDAEAVLKKLSELLSKQK